LNEWNEHVAKVKWEKLHNDYFAHQRRLEAKEQKNSSTVIKRVERSTSEKNGKD
jgi:hypothetical protein